MLKWSTTSKIECKVPPENVLLYAISDNSLEKKHVIIEMGSEEDGGIKVENLLDVLHREDDFSCRRGEFLVDAFYNCICDQIRW